MTLESSKTLGEIGALLMVIGPLAGGYTGVIGLVGLILVLVAFNGLADYYKDRRIFTNVLYGVIAAIIGAVIAVVIVLTAAFGILSVLGVSMSNWAGIQTFNWQKFTNWSAIAPFLVAIVGALIILVVSIVVTAILLRRSLDILSEKSGVRMFATAGLLFLIGAALTIVVIGLVLLWVAQILLAIAFFEIQIPPIQQQAKTI
jgi:uncharacterized membrane protein